MSGSITVDAEAMQSLVAKAIIDSMTPEKRNELIENAIKTVLATPRKQNSWDPDRSPLQLAFNEAVRICTDKMARDIIAEDVTFQAKLKELFADVAAQLFERDRDDLVDKIADAFASSLKKIADRY